MEVTLSWESIAMVLLLCALASASITEIARKLITQAFIERNEGERPWWRGTVLRLCSVITSTACGWLMVAENWRTGVILGIGAGALTTEAVGVARKLVRGRNGNGNGNGNGKNRVPGQRIVPTTDFKTSDETDFRPAITEDDIGTK